MLCEKCGGKIDSSKKCKLCGHDNSQVDYKTNPDVYMKPAIVRATRVTVYMWIVIVLDTLNMIGLINGLSKAYLVPNNRIILVICIVIGVLEIISCFFILKLKKWAVITFLVLSAIGGILLFIRGNWSTLIIRVALLYLVLSKNWDDFE